MTLDLDPHGFVPVVEHPVGLQLLIQHLDLSQARHEHQDSTWSTSGRRSSAQLSPCLRLPHVNPNVNMDSSLERG